MKKNIRSKISDFLTSEEGHAGVKPPLVLGAASASLLLAHAMVYTLRPSTVGTVSLGVVTVRKVNIA